jgi:hypothetical protein
MARNFYFSQGVKSEQNLYEDLIIESLKIYGQDVYYLPREIVDEDKLLGEDDPSRFEESYKIEMYIENTEGFEGEGDLFTKFGIEIRDQASFIVSRKRWRNTVGDNSNTIEIDRPREGDLIYLELSQSLFEIKHVENETPFYQLKNLPTFRMQCELFEYTNEDFDTNIEEIDDIDNRYAYEYVLEMETNDYEFQVGEDINQFLPSGITMSGEVSHWNPETRILRVIHVGADDGDYHELVSQVPINGINVLNVSEDLQQTDTEQNQIISDDAINILDFSETNPFGEPE